MSKKRSKRRKMSRVDRMFYQLDREKMWREQDERCHYCKEKIGRDEATFDHVVPISEVGYQHSIDNCVVACEDCNQNKANKTDWVYTEPEMGELQKIAHDLIEAWKKQVDEDLKRFEFKFTSDTKGGYHKWVRYWTKRGKWDK